MHTGKKQKMGCEAGRAGRGREGGKEDRRRDSKNGRQRRRNEGASERPSHVSCMYMSCVDTLARARCQVHSKTSTTTTRPTYNPRPKSDTRRMTCDRRPATHGLPPATGDRRPATCVWRPRPPFPAVSEQDRHQRVPRTNGGRGRCCTQHEQEWIFGLRGGLRPRPDRGRHRLRSAGPVSPHGATRNPRRRLPLQCNHGPSKRQWFTSHSLCCRNLWSIS